NGGNLFLTGNADKVRMLTVPEINKERGQAEAPDINSYGTIATEPADGLFRLDQLETIPGLESYEYSSSGLYWLGSPARSNASHLYYVSYDGVVRGYNNYNIGVRPVVSLRF
ncbi:MAG: DUF6273 domain-containing protein, partial [Clostridia bacterium]|nr:DUF6273 domain-containing protein [Clostridia bacterium]